MIEGIDVSNAQPAGIDWAKVASAGISFVIVKASEGTGYVDPKLMTHSAGARAAGLHVGAYHYLRVRAGRPQDAADQANGFCDAYLKAGCDLRPALDCEPTGNAGTSSKEWADAIGLWVGVVRQRLGCEPIIYTYPGFWAGLGKELTANPELAKLDLWVAHYTTAPQPTVPGPWKSWLMWQYAADAGVIGHVNGVPGNVDRSHLNADISVLLRQPPVPVQATPAAPDPAPQVTQENPAPTLKPGQPPALTGWLSQVLQWISTMMSKGQGSK